MKDEWFGIVRWCADDIRTALEESGIDPCQDNVDEVMCGLQHHAFEDAMISAGWDFINSVIDERRDVMASSPGCVTKKRLAKLLMEGELCSNFDEEAEFLLQNGLTFKE